MGGGPGEDSRRRTRGVRRAAGGPGARPRRPRSRRGAGAAASPAASATPTCTRPPGVDPSGYAPTVLGHEGAGRRARRIGEGVSSLARRRPRGHAVLAAVPRVRALPEPADEPLPGDPRAAEPGLPAGRHHAPLARGRADPPLHGHLDVRRVRGHARDRAREGRPRGAARPGLPVRLRPLDGPRRGDVHRRGASRARRAWCSAPGWSASARSPAAGCGAPSGSSASTSPRSASSSRAARARRTCWRGRRAHRRAGARADRRLRRRLHLRGDGPRAVMRQAVEAARMGWGLCTVCGVAGKGETLDVVPRLLITGRRICGSSFGGVKGATRCPSSSIATCAGRSTSTRSSPTACALDEVNRAFELMEAQDGIRARCSSRGGWRDLSRARDRHPSSPQPVSTSSKRRRMCLKK